MTSYGSLLSRTTFPRMDGSAPNRLRHNPSPSRTTRGAPGCSSSGCGVRPSAARIPSCSKNPRETHCAGSDTGSSTPVRFALQAP